MAGNLCHTMMRVVAAIGVCVILLGTAMPAVAGVCKSP
jgi:hypothetical protein